MTWQCPQDGNEVADGTNACPFCGYSRFPQGIVLRSDATGKELQLRLEATLGKSALGILGDPEVRYVSAEQFKVEKRSAQGGWAIVGSPTATNPLLLNGAPIDPSGAIVKDGDRLSIKEKSFRLTVRLLI
jgi:hypothetical protein